MRIAAVTGASRGIGRATVMALAGAGYDVFALARTESDLLSLSGEAARSGTRRAVPVPGKITPVVLDIASDESRSEAICTIMKATHSYGVDVLVNNAGYGQLGPIEEISADKLRRQLEVNVVGLVSFTQPFLPGMRGRRTGTIVNVSSVAGRVAAPFMGAYNASKFALEGLSDSMRVELSTFGVRVVLIEPGPIRTDFGRAADDVREEGPYSAYAPLLRRWLSAREGSNLLERSPQAVARVIVRAVQSKHPRARYTITVNAKVGSIVRRVAPDALVDWAFRRAMGGQGG